MPKSSLEKTLEKYQKEATKNAKNIISRSIATLEGK